MSSQPSKPKTAWHNLLKVPSKEVMIKLCNQTVLYKGLAAEVLPDSVVANWSSVLSITKGETRQLIISLAALLQQAIFLYASDPSIVSTAFPDDFHKDLRELLCSIVAKKFPDWKQTLADSNVTLPRLVDVQCRVENSSDESSVDIIPSTQAKCILQLKIEDTGESEATKLLDVQLSREKLDTMLDGLSKIRDQLTSVTQR